MKNIIPLVLFALGVLAFSYYNYQSRSKCINSIIENRKENGLVQIFHLKEMHFNVFDYILSDRRSFNFIFFDTSNFFFENQTNYKAYVQKWIEPCDLSTRQNLSFERMEDIFFITGYDQMWLEEYKDTLSINEIDNTIFEITDEWIRNNY